jgi:hypothetical protein
MREPTHRCQVGCPVEATLREYRGQMKSHHLVWPLPRSPLSKVKLCPSGLFLSLPPRLVAVQMRFFSFECDSLLTRFRSCVYRFHYKVVVCGINSCQIRQTNRDNRVLAALIQSGFPASLPHSRKLLDQEMPLKMMWVGTSPREANDSRTTLRVLANRPGPPSTGCPSGELLPSGMCPDRA